MCHAAGNRDQRTLFLQVAEQCHQSFTNGIIDIAYGLGREMGVSLSGLGLRVAK